MKAGRPVVIAQQGHARAWETLQHEAGARGCELVSAPEQVSES